MIGTGQDQAVRLPKARELGFETLARGEGQRAVDTFLELTGGTGAGLVVECSGSAAGIASIDMVRGKGRICAIGLTVKDSIPFPWDRAALKVCDLIFNLSTSFTNWERTNPSDRQRRPADRRRGVAPLAPGGVAAFREIEAQRALKVLLVPE